MTQPTPWFLALGLLAALGCGPDNTGKDEPEGPVDSDGDGLMDDEEEELGTDPDLADSDGDGFDDGVELEENTDPVDAEDCPYAGGWPIDACRHSIEATGSEVGEITSNFVLPDQFGEDLSLYDFCGKAILIEVAAFW